MRGKWYNHRQCSVGGLSTYLATISLCRPIHIKLSVSYYRMWICRTVGYALVKFRRLTCSLDTIRLRVSSVASMSWSKEAAASLSNAPSLLSSAVVQHNKYTTSYVVTEWWIPDCIKLENWGWPAAGSEHWLNATRLWSAKLIVAAQVCVYVNLDWVNAN